MKHGLQRGTPDRWKIIKNPPWDLAGSLWMHLWPTWLQNGAKMVPKDLQMEPKWSSEDPKRKEHINFLLHNLLLDFVDFHFLLGSSGDHFGSIWRSLGIILAPFCNQVGHRCTQRDPGRSQGGFLWFLIDLGSSFGHHFGSLLDMFCHLKQQNTCLDCKHVSWWFVSGKSADFWCPHLSKV